MTKHTPGPWKVSTNNKGQPAIMAYGQVCLLDSAPIVYMTDGEHDANATLIAAAPEMLAALERIYAELQRDLEQGLCISMVAMGQVEAAIQKAKGGAK